MVLDFRIKDTEKESQLLDLRIYYAIAVILILIALIVTRLIYLQILKYDHFVTLSQGNRVKVIPIAPSRGLIFTRDNILVADNRLSFSLELIPEQIEDINLSIGRLSELINIDIKDIGRFDKLVQSKRYFDNIPLKLDLSEEEIARFSVNKHKFSGVEVVARPYRYYPERSNLVHVLGYVGRIDKKDLLQLERPSYLATTHIGKLGVEKAYEDLLHGTPGYQQVEVNVQGRIVRVLERIAAKAGKNIHLTIDHSLQAAASELLQGKRGSIVAIDPNNGDILAFVASPAYDPNPFVHGIGEKSYGILLNAEDKPLINRALNGKYPPGSTIKPFLALAMLGTGIAEANKEVLCKGWYSLSGNSHRYRDWKKEGHGHVDLHYAIMQSCDVYFYSLAYELGINKVSSALADFGFGAKTGIDIGEESTGLVPSSDWKRRVLNENWYPGDTVITGIGQGYFLVTPLQLAKATAELASRGKGIMPRLVYRIGDAFVDSSDEYPVAPPVKRTVSYDPEHWDYVIRAMEDVVHGDRGTARASGKGSAYRFAGKTGTAQVFSIGQDEEYDEDTVAEHLKDHSLFIAFAPVNKPKIAIAVIVENSGSGSAVAAPVARKLLDHYLLDESGNLK